MGPFKFFRQEKLHNSINKSKCEFTNAFSMYVCCGTCVCVCVCVCVEGWQIEIKRECFPTESNF